jgi:dTDP-4-amino-4,6-dideoxygalactose transaminase
VQHADRDGLQEALQEAGIGTLIHYPIPPHLQKAYWDAGYDAGRFPIAESMANCLLSLPMGPQLTTQQQARVTKEMLAFTSKTPRKPEDDEENSLEPAKRTA